MNEEELNVKEEKMFLYQILEEHVENDKKHFNPCQECIRLGLQKGFQKGKLEDLRIIDEEIDKAKKCSAHICNFDYYDREEDVCLCCFEVSVLRELKEQLQKEIGGNEKWKIKKD